MDSPALQNNVALARLRRGEIEKSVEMLEEIARENPQFATAASNLALVLRHWLFEDERAGVYEAQALAMETPQLSEAVLYELLSPVEDTAPAVPPVDGRAAGQPTAADSQEAKD
ncbi:MAG: hypothetical protein GWN29_05185 [Gammaproteobacteria bacterium]|nr:hypothetical protein [Gammaproteobacteria bacterium]